MLSRKRRQIDQKLPIFYRKSLIGFRMVNIHLTLAHFKGQSQDDANFDCESLKWWLIEQILLLPTHKKLPVGFRMVYLHLILVLSKCQGQCHSQFDCKNSIKLSCCILPYISVYAALHCSFQLSDVTKVQIYFDWKKTKEFYKSSRKLCFYQSCSWVHFSWLDPTRLTENWTWFDPTRL